MKELIFRLEVVEGETGLWYATSPDVKGLLTIGETREEAERNVPQTLFELLVAEQFENARLKARERRRKQIRRLVKNKQRTSE